MIWHMSYQADPKARTLADRHYSRRLVGSTVFVPPGRGDCVLFEAWREAKRKAEELAGVASETAE